MKRGLASTPHSWATWTGHLLLCWHRVAEQGRDLDDVQQRGPLGEDVFGGLPLHPGAPLTAANLAGEVRGRQEGQEELRPRQALEEDFALPVGEVADVRPVEEPPQLAPARQLPKLIGEGLQEALDPAL